jgi:hypothetical protein
MMRTSPYLAEPRKSFQHPIVELREEPGQERDAGQHQEAAHHPLHEPKMRAKARQEGGERLDREGGGDERQAEAQRIDRQRPTGFCISSRPCRCNRLIGVIPKKCRPITMITTPATVASAFE